MNVSDLELFVRVADAGSIGGAARQLNISSAVASAGIKRLEKELGIKLLVRSTRQLCLSTLGEHYLRFCRRAIAELDEGSKAILSESGLISGELRLSIPSDFGRNHLLGWLDDFMVENPLVSFMVRVSDELSDFYSDRVDVAIRYGDLEDSSLIAFRLITTERVLCVSPTYLEKHGEPVHPDDLKSHNCLLFQQGEVPFNSWIFKNSGGSVYIRASGDRVTNDADIVRRWALAGYGIAFKSKLDVVDELKNGSLVQILCQFPTPPLDMWLICPDRNLLTPAIMALKDNLQLCLRERLDV